MIQSKVKHADFAERFIAACDGNPHCPPPNYGRLGWIAKQFKDRYGVKVSNETVRRWSSGEARPRPDKVGQIAEILQVDSGWLSVGGNQRADSGRKERNRKMLFVDGAVQVLAGLIRMSGGNVALPDPSDTRAVSADIDLYAIIKGAQYSVTVAVAEPSNGELTFRVSAKAEENVVIGIVLKPDLCFEVYELPWEIIAESGEGRMGKYELTVDADAPEAAGLRRIHSFADRM